MYGLILAGGSGSRLWPLSRELYPKQLLNIQNSESLLQSTFMRLKECMPVENIISITGVKHSPNVRYQLSSLTESPVVLSEPIAKNTAPAIILAGKYISEISNDDPVILVVPLAIAANTATVINKSGALDKSTSIAFSFPAEPIST